MIAWLLHIANSNPPGPRCERERFYAMKTRILNRFASDDGFDYQHIEGKKCWSCDGTGIYYHYSGTPDDCHRCWGSGWYKSPVYVALRRWKFGRYTFHEPVGRANGLPPNWADPLKRPVIEGYIKHACYSRLAVDWSSLVLGVLFDRGVAADVVRDWWRWSWTHAVLTRRCHTCKRRLWTARQWQCRRCLLNPKPEVFDDEIPF